VSKGDYDRIVSERDELKSKVAELEAVAAKAEAAASEKKAEEDKQEVITNEPGVYGDIHYFIAPVSIVNRVGQWTIEEFEITGLDKSYDKNHIRIDYTCVGTGDRGLIEFFCYDKDGYQVDKFFLSVGTNSNTNKFKVQEQRDISTETVRIDIE